MASPPETGWLAGTAPVPGCKLGRGPWLKQHTVSPQTYAVGYCKLGAKSAACDCLVVNDSLVNSASPAARQAGVGCSFDSVSFLSFYIPTVKVDGEEFCRLLPVTFVFFKKNK